MRITLAVVGRARDGPVRAIVNDYSRRLPWEIEFREVAEQAGPDRREREGEKLLAALPDGAAVVALDTRGKSLSSEAFAAWIGRQRDGGCRDMAFVIGGADGLAPNIIESAALVLSLGALTWPHLLVRAMLVEQLYRAASILAGHPYHLGHR